MVILLYFFSPPHLHYVENIFYFLFLHSTHKILCLRKSKKLFLHIHNILLGGYNIRDQLQFTGIFIFYLLCAVCALCVICFCGCWNNYTVYITGFSGTNHINIGRPVSNVRVPSVFPGWRKNSKRALLWKPLLSLLAQQPENNTGELHES